MKTLYKHRSLTLLFCLTFTYSAMIAQVGVNINSPKGALDVNSGTMGMVFPVVALVNATTETVVNPNGGGIVAGTTVYNTTTLDDGPDSLYPGVFTWKLHPPSTYKWTSLREKKDNALFLQDTDVRTGSDDVLNPVLGKQTIPFDDNTFTPIYTGRYALHLVVQYGAGNLDDSAMSGTQFVNFAKQAGEFEFIFNGTTHTIDLSSFSTYNNDSQFNGGSLRLSTNIFNQIGIDFVEVLTSGTPYPFSLTFNQEDAQGFEGDGDISGGDDGRGYVTMSNNVKCYLEINYVYE